MRRQSYDAAGDLIFDGINAMAYDAENRVCASANSLTGTITQYIYDAEGHRVAKVNASSMNGGSLSCAMSPAGSVEATYILGPSGEQMTELDQAGNWKHTNIFAGGTLLATYDTVGLHFPLTDALGTKRVQVSGTGNVELSCTGLPYGDGLSCSGPGKDATEHHFTGKVRDTESGLDYFGARYYGSSTGRFMSPDWSDETDPVPYADLSNPQSLNLYSYVGNNPLIHVDADGHCWPQFLCNFVVDLKNKLVHGEFTTDTTGAKIRQLDREEARDREMRQYEETHPPRIVEGIVFNPETALMFLQANRPAFVPKSWIQKLSKTGTKFVDPNNNHNNVRLEPAKPGSPNPGQQRDYMVVTKNGHTLDANGNEVPRQSLESHIPQGTELPPETFGPIE